MYVCVCTCICVYIYIHRSTVSLNTNICIIQKPKGGIIQTRKRGAIQKPKGGIIQKPKGGWHAEMHSTCTNLAMSLPMYVQSTISTFQTQVTLVRRSCPTGMLRISNNSYVLRNGSDNVVSNFVDRTPID